MAKGRVWVLSFCMYSQGCPTWTFPHVTTLLKSLHLYRLFIIISGIQWRRSKQQRYVQPMNIWTHHYMVLIVGSIVLDTKQQACAEIMADKVHICSITSRPCMPVGPPYRTLHRALRTPRTSTPAVYFQCVLRAFLIWNVPSPWYDFRVFHNIVEACWKGMWSETQPRVSVNWLGMTVL